jgi:putative membrane protein insertion efficiency factor
MEAHDNRGTSPAAKVLIVLIRGYQRLIGPMLPPSCRYVPSCSQYAIDAVISRGALRGSWLGLRRILRCHPFGGHGLDPVPPRVRCAGTASEASEKVR